MNKYTILYLIVFLEGYFVLSTELLYMRQLAPFVGNNVEITSIIISAVLLPLSLGYYYGGHNIVKNFRKKLVINLSVSSIMIGFSLSYIFQHSFFDSLASFDVLFKVSLFSILFIVSPMFLLGQTIPLISNFYKSKSFSKLTGKLLFLSTKIKVGKEPKLIACVAFPVSSL